MVFVSTNEQGIVWAIDDEADIWVLKTGSLDVEPPVQNEEHGWILIPENELIQVDVGYNAQVVGVTENHEALFRTGITVELPQGDGWEQIEGRSIRHASMCSNGEIWATSPDGHVYHRTEVSRYQITGEEWVTVSEQGTLRQVSCGRYGQVWGVANTRDVMVRSGVTALTTAGNGWTTVGNQRMSYVSIGHDG
jgi:hypothetical protein